MGAVHEAAGAAALLQRTPWPHQERAIQAILNARQDNPAARMLLVMPPGGGKTFVVARVLVHLGTEHGARGLILAHRREMVSHHYEHLRDNGVPPSLLGVIMGRDKRENHRALIQIASVDTLHHRNKPLADIVVTDEAHRDASPGRRRLRRFYRKAFQLGVTGSPCRLDGRGLASDFDELLVGATMSELLADGHIVAPTIYTVPEELLPNVGDVPMVAGDYDADALDRAVNRRSLVGAIVPHWLEHAQGRKTVVFATSIEHSKNITQAFEQAGIVAAHIDSYTATEERARLLWRFEHGDLTVLSCVNILAEGWDCPPCKCLVLARPTCSLNLHLQQCGRCMRPWGSVTPIILDHAGNVLVHGLPQMDREWSLREDAESLGDGTASVKHCPRCLLVVPAATATCPRCALELRDVREEPAEMAGQLRLYVAGTPGTAPIAQRPSDPWQNDRVDWETFLLFAEAQGLSHAWAVRTYEQRYDGRLLTLRQRLPPPRWIMRGDDEAVARWYRIHVMRRLRRDSELWERTLARGQATQFFKQVYGRPPTPRVRKLAGIGPEVRPPTNRFARIPPPENLKNKKAAAKWLRALYRDSLGADRSVSAKTAARAAAAQTFRQGYGELPSAEIRALAGFVPKPKPPSRLDRIPPPKNKRLVHEAARWLRALYDDSMEGRRPSNMYDLSIAKGTAKQVYRSVYGDMPSDKIMAFAGLPMARVSRLEDRFPPPSDRRNMQAVARWLRSLVEYFLSGRAKPTPVDRGRAKWRAVEVYRSVFRAKPSAKQRQLAFG